jgi:hypothetical protein
MVMTSVVQQQEYAEEARMAGPHRPAGSGSWARAQQIGPEFRATTGWVLERGGGRWWRLPLAVLIFAAVTFIGFLVVSLIAGTARRVGTAEGPLAVLIWLGLGVSAVVGVFVAGRIVRPPLRWVPRERLMAVKSDQQRRLEAGAEGEFITGEHLRPLEAEGYLVRHSVEVPGEVRPLDHVVIGPTGLFVVESKYYVEDVYPIAGRLFGDGTPLDAQVAVLRHQCEVMWRRASAEAGISVRGVFSMVGNQTTPPFALDHAVWCVPGRDLAAVIRTWHPRRLEPQLVHWLAAKVDQAFGLDPHPRQLGPPPLHDVLVGTACDRPGCEGRRELRESETGPYLGCSDHDRAGCRWRWTLDGWPLPPAPH